MGKLYREFFYVPKYRKISDRVMTVRVALSVFVVVACLTVLSLSTYAWFSAGVTSGTNTIRTADFDITVSVTLAEPVQGVYKLENGEYSVLLTKTGKATTGFCVVEITAGETKTTLHTQQLGRDGEIERGELTFTLKASGLSEPATVSFTPYWGTSVYYGDQERPHYIENASTVNIAADGVLVVTDNPQEEEEETPETPSNPDQTEQPTTVPETTVPDTTTTPETTPPETTGTSGPTSTTEPSTPENTEPAATEPSGATEPSTPENTEPAATEPSGATEPSTPENTEPAATEPSSTTEPSTQATEPMETEPTETQPVEETTGAPTTEASSE